MTILIWRRGSHERRQATRTSSKGTSGQGRADGESGAVSRIGSADAVVADVEPQHAAGRVDPDANVGRLRVLGRIRQCLRYDVIGRDLNLFSKLRLNSYIELYMDR